MKNKKRPSISVTGKIYERLRTSVDETSVSQFVDGILQSALDDQTIRNRVLAKCAPRRK